MKIRKIIPILVAVAFLLTASSAMASYVIDFGVVAGHGTDSGTIGYDGTGGLVGTDIEVDEVYLKGSGSTLALTNGLLNFETGNLTSFNPSGSLGREWSFGSGGEITITADVGGSTNVVLMDGEWTGAKVVETSTTGVLKFEVVVGGFTDEKNLYLLYALGLLSTDPGIADFDGPFSGSINLSFYLTSSSTGEYFLSTDIASGDILNTSVPVPGAVYLLGSGLIGLLGIRRKLKK